MNIKRLPATACLLVFVGALTPAPLTAGDCGCDRSYCGTVIHHHCRCRHHCCDCQPPYGVVVPSAPAFAAPLVAAPVYAAPVTYAAPLNYAPQAAPQCNSSQSAGLAAPGRAEDQLATLLRAALMGNGNGASAAPAAAPSVPPDTTLEERVNKIEQRVATLEQISRSLAKLVESHEQTLHPQSK